MITGTQQLMQEVDLGLQVESFLNGPVGKYLIGRAEDEIAEAVQELKTVVPTDVEKITALQNVVHRAESIQYWLAEAVQAGLNAQQELQDT